MGVSKNRGTPKSSILIGFSNIDHPFWGFSPYFWKHPYITLPKTNTSPPENGQLPRQEVDSHLTRTPNVRRRVKHPGYHRVK